MTMTKFRNLTATFTPRSSLFFSSSLKNYFFSSSPFPSPLPIDTVSETAADVAGEVLYPDASTLPSPVTLPTLLQPRVVVYDGVCHLCHRGYLYVIWVSSIMLENYYARLAS